MSIYIFWIWGRGWCVDITISPPIIPQPFNPLLASLLSFSHHLTGSINNPVSMQRPLLASFLHRTVLLLRARGEKKKKGKLKQREMSRQTVSIDCTQCKALYRICLSAKTSTTVERSVNTTAPSKVHTTRYHMRQNVFLCLFVMHTYTVSCEGAGHLLLS